MTNTIVQWMYLDITTATNMTLKLVSWTYVFQDIVLQFS